MAIGAPGSCSSCAAMAAGWRTMLEARRMNSVADLVDIVDPRLGSAFDAMEALGQAVVDAAVEIQRLETVGGVIDLLA